MNICSVYLVLNITEMFIKCERLKMKVNKRPRVENKKVNDGLRIGEGGGYLPEDGF